MTDTARRFMQRALIAHEDHAETVEELGRNFTAEKRRQLAAQGKAIPVRNEKGEIVNGRFPIENAGDVQNAVALAKTDEERQHVIKNARKVGATDKIPDHWKKGGKK